MSQPTDLNTAGSLQIIQVLSEISSGIGHYPISHATIEAVITYIKTSKVELIMWEKKQPDQRGRALWLLLEKSGVPDWLAEGVRKDEVLSRYTR